MLLEIANLQDKELKKEYRKLVLKYHPDNKVTGDNEKMAEISNAAEKGDEVFKNYLLHAGNIYKNSFNKFKDPELPKKEENKFKNYILILKVFENKAKVLSKENNVKIDIDIIYQSLHPFIKITIKKLFKKNSYFVNLNLIIDKFKFLNEENINTIANYSIEEALKKFFKKN